MANTDQQPTTWVESSKLEAAYWDHVEAQIDRHDRALARAGAAHAVIFSGAPKRRFLDDSYYPFQANPHFVSWLPLTAHPNCYIVHTPSETPRLIYFQEHDYWHMPPDEPAGYWTSYFDIRIVRKHEDIAEHLPQTRDKCILIGEIDDGTQAFGIERINPTPAIDVLHFARAIKTQYEIECLRGASSRAVAGHRAAEAAFRDGASEFAIHLAYCAAVEQAEKDLPYGNIVALNEHAAVLHYQNQAPVVPADTRSFLIDAGASVNGYAADVTRSYAFASNDYASLIERMDELQQAIVAQVRAGVDYADLHARTHEMIAALLVDMELATGSVDALISNGVTSAFYPHGLGHFLGLQVHDVAGFMADENGSIIERPPQHPFLRLTRKLEADQVLTIEPGLYFIDMLLENLNGTPGQAMLNPKAIDELRPFGGVRIEDNVRVLEDGCENLTRDAFESASRL